MKYMLEDFISNLKTIIVKTHLKEKQLKVRLCDLIQFWHRFLERVVPSSIKKEREIDGTCQLKRFETRQTGNRVEK